jgi:hypothetical protein
MYSGSLESDMISEEEEEEEEEKKKRNQKMNYAQRQYYQ